MFLHYLLLRILAILTNDGLKLALGCLRPQIRRSEYRVFQGRAALTTTRRPAQTLNRFAHDDLRIADILIEIFNNRLNGDCVMGRMPTVVISDKRQRGVTDFS